eukprot:Pgem_evm1s4736
MYSEIRNYKLNEMEVHAGSRCHTNFHFERNKHIAAEYRKQKVKLLRKQSLLEECEQVVLVNENDVLQVRKFRAHVTAFETEFER